MLMHRGSRGRGEREGAQTRLEGYVQESSRVELFAAAAAAGGDNDKDVYSAAQNPC